MFFRLFRFSRLDELDRFATVSSSPDDDDEESDDDEPELDFGGLIGLIASAMFSTSVSSKSPDMFYQNGARRYCNARNNCWAAFAAYLL